MNAPVSCDRVAAAILGEAALPDDLVSTHVASCASCRALASAHSAAVLLRGKPFAEGVPVEAASVRALVRRRKAVRRSIAVLATAAAIVMGVVALRSQEPPAKAAPGPSLVALATEVEGYWSRDLATAGATYSAFGTLPRWLAPPHARRSDSVWPETTFPWEGEKKEVSP